MNNRLIKKVLSRQYTFGGSTADLALLRSIHDGTYANAKPGEASFHAYAAALNVALEFATQALDVLELIPFNNQLADTQDEYMPSYPPLSPVTTAFFSGWMVLDAREPSTGVTLGGMFAEYLKTQRKYEYVGMAVATLNHSHRSFYEVMAVGQEGVRLWDIAGHRELQCWNSSGYAGRPGEVWYVRVLPPLLESSGRSVTLNTPYVFSSGDRRLWEDFFQRRLGSQADGGVKLRDYLKYGDSLEYWLEFIFQSYTGHTGNAIFVSGVPDDATSRPHFQFGRKL